MEDKENKGDTLNMRETTKPLNSNIFVDDKIKKLNLEALNRHPHPQKASL